MVEISELEELPKEFLSVKDEVWKEVFAAGRKKSELELRYGEPLREQNPGEYYGILDDVRKSFSKAHKAAKKYLKSVRGIPIPLRNSVHLENPTYLIDLLEFQDQIYNENPVFDVMVQPLSQIESIFHQLWIQALKSDLIFVTPNADALSLLTEINQGEKIEQFQCRDCKDESCEDEDVHINFDNYVTNWMSEFNSVLSKKDELEKKYGWPLRERNPTEYEKIEGEARELFDKIRGASIAYLREVGSVPIHLEEEIHLDNPTYLENILRAERIIDFDMMISSKLTKGHRDIDFIYEDLAKVAVMRGILSPAIYDSLPKNALSLLREIEE